MPETPDSGMVDKVYNQLRAIAHAQMRHERASHTLQATALIHEAYLRIGGDRAIPWANRAHFFAAAAEAMRRLLIDHARARGAVKRGGGARAAFGNVADLAATDSSEIVRFDDAFQRLESENPDAAAVVRLRFFAGLSVDQAAEALGISPATVDRRWAFARAWLHRKLEEEVS